MRSYLEKGIMIAVSALFLILFINSNKLSGLLGHKVVEVRVLSVSDVEKRIEEKELIEIIPELVFNESEIAYDRQMDTIYIPQNISGKNFEGALKTVNPGSKIYFKEDEYFKNPAEAMKEGYSFELYLVNEEGYHIYHTVFTGMPLMCITTEDFTEAEEETIYSGLVQVYDQYRTGAELQRAKCNYNVRGGTSRSYEKAGYKLELTDEKLSFLGMREDDDWILNSLYDDAGLIHNKVSFEVWRNIAAYNNVPSDDGVTGEYIELFLDNEYLGVYLLTERVDNKTLSLNKKDILYKCRAARIPEECNYTNEDVDGMEPIFILKYPKNFEEEDWEPLKDWVNAFCKEQISSFDEGEKLLNMENAVDYNLFILLICGGDNTRKNSFLIADYQGDGSYQFKKVPWDMNASWGNPWVDNEASNYTIYDPESMKDVNTWYSDISTLYYYDEAEVSSLLRNRWQEIRNNGLISEESLFQIVDVQLEYLHNSGAYDRNYERWPHGSEYWKDEYIYDYIEGRLEFLDEYFERLYEDTQTPAVYDGIDYSNEFEPRFYWERYKTTLSELYDYDRQQLLEHYVLYGKPYELHGRRSSEFPDDWEYMYGSKAEGESE